VYYQSHEVDVYLKALYFWLAGSKINHHFKTRSIKLRPTTVRKTQIFKGSHLNAWRLELNSCFQVLIICSLWVWFFM